MSVVYGARVLANVDLCGRQKSVIGDRQGSIGEGEGEEEAERWLYHHLRKVRRNFFGVPTAMRAQLREKERQENVQRSEEQANAM